MMRKIANAIVGGMYGAILSYNFITHDYKTAIFAMVGWVAFMVYIGTNRGE